MQEQWKVVDGFGGKYKVSNKGRVMSVARDVSNHTGIIKKKDYILSQHKDQKGYMRVYLDLDGKTKFVPVHRLVALAFIPNEMNKPQVNHIDGTKTNNDASNLEWVTNQENQLHAVRLGLNDHSKYVGGKKKRPVIQIDRKTKEIVAEYPSIADASKAMCGSKTSNIGECCRGKRNHSFGYEWAYREEVM